MKTRLKNSMAISAVAHCIILLPLVNLVPVEHRVEQPKPIAVDYIIVKEPAIFEAKSDTSTPAVSKVELKKDVELKPSANTAPQIPKSPEPAKEAAQDLAKRQAQARSTKDYINYYQLIREKIRQRLKAHYTDYNRQGEVNLVFELSSDGKLVALAIENAGSTTDKVLRNIAATSVKQAAPFAPFPQKLNLPRMSFNLTVSFKKD
ncbi:MAG: hypothetical protein WC592_03785 [Candidatus Omnitrophota bacterium]